MQDKVLTCHKYKIALLQLDTGPNIEKNKESAARYIEDAARKGAKLVILPEHSDVIAINGSSFAEDIPGPTTSFFGALSKQHNIYLNCGSITEKNGSSNPFNTSVLFSPHGDIIAKYRKLHMFDVDIKNGPNIRESNEAAKGSEVSIAKTLLGNIGLSICYDLRFPELYRIMALNGAQILTVSANFTEMTGKAHWETLLRARAIENGCYVAASDQCGVKYNVKAWGHTMLVNPWGEIVAELCQEPGVLTAEIDLNQVLKAQTQIPVLRNIRKDTYTLKSGHIQIY